MMRINCPQRQLNARLRSRRISNDNSCCFTLGVEQIAHLRGRTPSFLNVLDRLRLEKEREFAGIIRDSIDARFLGGELHLVPHLFVVALVVRIAEKVAC